MFDKDKGWQGSNVRHETLARWDQRISKSIVQLSSASPCGVGQGYATVAHLTPFGISCLIEIVMHNNGGANSLTFLIQTLASVGRPRFSARRNSHSDLTTALHVKYSIHTWIPRSLTTTDTVHLHTLY
jgi:hypothetical protein